MEVTHVIQALRCRCRTGASLALMDVLERSHMRATLEDGRDLATINDAHVGKANSSVANAGRHHDARRADADGNQGFTPSNTSVVGRPALESIETRKRWLRHNPPRTPWQFVTAHARSPPIEQPRWLSSTPTERRVPRDNPRSTAPDLRNQRLVRHPRRRRTRRRPLPYPLLQVRNPRGMAHRGPR